MRDARPAPRSGNRRAFRRWLRGPSATPTTSASPACSQRIEQLTERLTGLEARREELAIDNGDEPEPLTDDDLRTLQAHVRAVIEAGDPPARKALLQALVAEIRVVSREEIYPTFNLPAVRPPCGSVELAGLEPATSWVRYGNPSVRVSRRFRL